MIHHAAPLSLIASSMGAVLADWRDADLPQSSAARKIATGGACSQLVWWGLHQDPVHVLYVYLHVISERHVLECENAFAGEGQDNGV